jgi:predicted phage-related endonuclease
MNELTTLQQLPAGHDRRKYIGGSDAASILGLSPWGTPLDLFYKKLSDTPEEISDKKAKFFRNRKDQEPIIARRLEREYGVVVTKLSLDENPNRYVDSQYPFMVAEIDFEFLMTQAVRDHFPDRPDFAAIPDGTLLNGEIKTVHPLAAGKWGEIGSEDLPIEYASQVMWGLGITHRPACLVAALFGIDDLLCFPVMADEDTIAAMRARAFTFWFEHVLTGIPPPPINIDDVLKLYAGFNGKPVELSDEAYEALKNLDILRATMRNFESDQGELEWRIARCVAIEWGAELQASKNEKPIISTKEDAILMYAGTQAGSWNRQSRTGIDVKRLREEAPEIAEADATESQFRVFRIKKPKGT